MFHQGLYSQNNPLTKISGTFLGQNTPGEIPEVFGKNIASKDHSNGGFVFSGNGMEVFFFSISKEGKQFLQYSELENGYWTEPEKIFFVNSSNAIHPFFSPDSKRIYFGTDRRIDQNDEVPYYNIWVSERTPDKWTEPQPINPIINTGYENCGSFAKGNKLYFRRISATTRGDIFLSTCTGNEFSVPVKLPEEINTVYDESHPAISPDNSYLIFSSKRPGGFNYGKDDLWISFKKADGDWSKAINMGNDINNGNNTSCATISPDGKYMFFIRIENGIGIPYWVSAKIIENIRLQSADSRYF